MHTVSEKINVLNRGNQNHTDSFYAKKRKYRFQETKRRNTPVTILSLKPKIPNLTDQTCQMYETEHTGNYLTFKTEPNLRDQTNRRFITFETEHTEQTGHTEYFLSSSVQSSGLKRFIISQILMLFISELIKKFNSKI